MRVATAFFCCVATLFALASCGRDPELAPVRAAIESVVRGPSGDFACTVASIEVGEFVEASNALGVTRTAAWSAMLVLDDDLVGLVERLDGHDVFIPLLERGTAVRFRGEVDVRGPNATRRIEPKVVGSELAERVAAVAEGLAARGAPSSLRLRGRGRLSDPIEWDSPTGQSLRALEQARQAAAKAAPHSRLLDVVAPPHGGLLLRNGDPSRPSRLIAATIDPALGMASGRGVDLSRLPPQEFHFELRSDPHGAGSLELQRSDEGSPLRFLRGERGAFRAGAEFELMAASPARSMEFTEVETALRAAIASVANGEAANVVDVSDLTREGYVEVALTGSVVFDGRLDRARAGLFRIPTSTPTNWREGTVAVRLPTPLPARGVLVRGGAVASGAFEIAVNGTPAARIDALPAKGARIVRLPADAMVAEVAILARGALSLLSVSAVR